MDVGGVTVSPVLTSADVGGCAPDAAQMGREKWLTDQAGLPVACCGRCASPSRYRCVGARTRASGSPLRPLVRVPAWRNKYPPAAAPLRLRATSRTRRLLLSRYASIGQAATFPDRKKWARAAQPGPTRSDPESGPGRRAGGTCHLAGSWAALLGSCIARLGSNRRPGVWRVPYEAGPPSRRPLAHGI